MSRSSSSTRFTAALGTADLATVLAGAAEVPHLQLADALEILILRARDRDLVRDRITAALNEREACPTLTREPS